MGEVKSGPGYWQPGNIYRHHSANSTCPVSPQEVADDTSQSWRRLRVRSAEPEPKLGSSLHLEGLACFKGSNHSKGVLAPGMEEAESPENKRCRDRGEAPQHAWHQRGLGSALEATSLDVEREHPSIGALRTGAEHGE